MNKLSLRAYGKINLTLDIVGMRSDGYHLLSGIMQTISLYNHITLEKADVLALWCDDESLPTDIKNTAMKAATLFFHEVNTTEKVLITLEKHIPYQAGLGSASADAAGVLLGLNKLFGGIVPFETLIKIGERVGADVPFSMIGGTAHVTGIGEKILPLSPIEECYIAIVCPNAPVSTPVAYKLLDNQCSYTKFTDNFLKSYNVANILPSAHLCGNVFGSVSNKILTDEITKNLMDNGALGAALSGSGSAVFGIFKNFATANAAISIYTSAFVTVPCASSIFFE